MKKKNILIIIILISLFIYWFQEIDKYNKNKNKKKIIKVVDKVKFPILLSMLCDLVYLSYVNLEPIIPSALNFKKTSSRFFSQRVVIITLRQRK